MRQRRDARTDANQADIVKAMEDMGASVWVIGWPVDLLVGAGGRTCPVEVKVLVGKREPKPKPYTKTQKDFLATWRGGPVGTITDVEGAINLVRAMRGEA